MDYHWVRPRADGHTKRLPKLRAILGPMVLQPFANVVRVMICCKLPGRPSAICFIGFGPCFLGFYAKP